MTHSNQTAIRTLIDWSDAVYERDRNRVAANRTEGIVMFKVPEPLQAKGPDASQETRIHFLAAKPAKPERFRVNEPPQSGLLGLRRLAVALRDRLAAAKVRRREGERLRAMPDNMLRDIGLTRDDVRSEAALRARLLERA